MTSPAYWYCTLIASGGERSSFTAGFTGVDVP
jgi:hypothetical protein